MNYVLRKGDKGQEIKRLQSKLSIKIDGDFGPITEKAVKDFQSLKSLTIDGIAGPITLSALGMSVIFGVDLSRHNGDVDFVKLSKSGCKFAWIKLTEGTDHVNPGFVEKFKGCRDNGIVVGAYHFGRPDTNAHDPRDASNESKNFLDALNQVGLNSGDLLPVLDLEAGMKTDDQFNIDWALNWLEEVGSKERVKPIIYTAKWYYGSYMKNASKPSLNKLAKHPLWLASYNEGVEPERTVPIWDQWSIWQWSGSGSVPGVKGKCDLNWIAGGKFNDLRVP